MLPIKPSIAALEKLFQHRASDARAILDANTEELIERLAGTHDRYFLGRLHLADLRMEALNALDSGTHGVERIVMRKPRSGATRTIRYLNTGDTYSITLARITGSDLQRVTYRITTWGDEVERAERLGFRAE